MIWFLEAGWDVFSPVADTNATDLVVRLPGTSRLISVQVKQKQPGGKNAGQLLNKWTGEQPPFDYLVFYQPEKARGLILPASVFSGRGKTLFFFGQDGAGYSTGKVRPVFRDFEFDLAALPHHAHPMAFAAKFESVHENEADAKQGRAALADFRRSGALAIPLA